MSIIALAVAAAVSGQTAAAAPQRSATDLTRDLNSAPPIGQTSRPATGAAPEQEEATPAPAAEIRRGVPHAAPQAAPQATPQTPRPEPEPRPAQIAPAPTPVRPQPAPSLPASAPPVQAAPVTPTPVRPVPAAPTQTAPAPARPSPSAPGAMNAAAIAELPFRLELPSGVTMASSPAGADGTVYAVRRGDQALLMIYAGPSSQFPIYDGQIVRAGGRVSVIVPEGNRRLAMEHLFERASAPKEIHVWISAPGGSDRDLAEQIGQSVDPR